jgi:two-component system, LuxR family, sensor kinase FixL
MQTSSRSQVAEPEPSLKASGTQHTAPETANPASSEASILDALPTGLAILDAKGVVTAVNRAWQEYLQEHHPHLIGACVGASFFESCKRVLDPNTSWGQAAAQGVRDVLAGRRAEYRMRYPTGVSDQTVWHALEVRRIPEGPGAIVAHEDITGRVRFEAALRESERRYDLATSAANVWVWERNFTTGDWYIDPTMKAFAGYSAGDMDDSLNAWRRVIPPEDYRKIDDSVVQLLAHEIEELDVEHRLLCKDGSIRWIRARGNLSAHHEGDQPRLLGTSVDITKAKEAEEALRRSESKQRALIASIPDIIVRLSRDGTILAYKHARNSASRTPADQLVGQPVDAILPPEACDDVRTAVAEVLTTGNIATIEYRTDDGGDVRFYEGRLVASGGDDVVAVVREITDRRLAEDELLSEQERLEQQVRDRLIDLEAARRELATEVVERRKTAELLRQREEEYRKTFQHAPLGLATVDHTGRFIQINQAFCRLFGYAESELLALTFRDITHPEDLAASNALFERRVGEGAGNEGVRSLRKRYLRKDGSVVEAVVHTVSVRGANGSPDRFVAQIEDRTEQLRAQAEVRRQRERLAHVARVSTLGEMAAGIAHEVNQPLTAIANYTQACDKMLRGDGSPTTKALGVLTLIRDEALRAGEIIHRIRDLTHRREERRARCGMNHLIRDIMTLAEADARVQNVNVRLQLEDGLPDCFADGIQIQQVVLNLVRNAVEATEGVTDSGPVILRTRLLESGEVVVEVIDRGKGIAEEDEAHVYRPFYTTKPTGMGMGLSISRSIVSAHGGRLWHIPNPDRGLTFCFTLPVAKA